MNTKSFFLAALVLCACNVGIRPVLAGGSCQNSSECDDGNDCTADSCVLNSCRHDPVPVNTPCGDSSDTVCTDPDRCSPGGVCLRNDAANGTNCTAANLCITGESCNSGFCVGAYTTNCCTAPADCNDHNPCTNDTCAANACQHSNAAPGTPCGSSVDDACTNPDTCDASGQCQNNDTNDGADCGGPDCLGGVCGEDTYRATLLPEGNNIGSETRGLALFEGDPDRPIIVGRVIEAGEVDHAVAWTCAANATNCALTELPEGVAVTSVVNGMGCDEQGLCLVVGSKGSPPQPAAWVYNGVTWTAELIPLPPTHVHGAITGRELDIPKRTAVGHSMDAQGLRRATYWERSIQGVWSVFVLPDFGVPGRDSAATDIYVCHTGAPTQLCVDGARLIAGWAEDGAGIVHPVIWRESGDQSGTFAMNVLPLPVGVSGVGEDDFLDEIGIERDRTGEGLVVVGTVVLTDGTTRGVIWHTQNFQSWTSTVLVPLAGFTNSYAISSSYSLCAKGLLMYYRVKGKGASYPPGGDPLLDGMATQWQLDETTLALTSGPTDMNSIISGLPPSCRFGGGGIRPLGGSWDGFAVPPPMGGSVVCSSATAAGTPQPHGAIAFAGPPAGIPAVSTWGMFVMGLLVVTAATIATRRNTDGVGMACTK